MSTCIISFANQKGGVGKTTLTIMAANLLSAYKVKVAVIDTDHQRSCEELRKAQLQEVERSGEVPDCLYPIIGVAEKDLDAVIQNLSKDYPVLLLDLPGNLRQETEVGGKKVNVALSALQLSDVVILPLVPSRVDMHSSKEALQLLSKIKERRPELQVALVLNKMNNTGESVQLVEWARGYADATGFQVLQAKFRERVEYKRISTVQPLVVTDETDPLLIFGRELKQMIKTTLQHA